MTDITGLAERRASTSRPRAGNTSRPAPGVPVLAPEEDAVNKPGRGAVSEAAKSPQKVAMEEKKGR